MNDIGILTSQILKDELNIIYKSTIDSTNTYAKESFESLTYPAIIIASSQSNGRGRNTNSWASTTAGDSLYATWCFRTNTPPCSVLPMRIGLLLQAATETHFNIVASLKAPNDVFIGSKKNSGILIEGVNYKEQFYTFIGIGINVLSKPILENTTHLTEHIHFDVKNWKAFLITLTTGMTRNIASTQNSLNTTEQEQLLVALKKHLAFKNLQSVSSFGDLVFPDKTINWIDL